LSNASNGIKIARDVSVFRWNYFPLVAPSSKSTLFLVLNKRRFLFSTANVTLRHSLRHSMLISMPCSMRNHMRRAKQCWSVPLIFNILEIRVTLKIDSNPCYPKICETFQQEWKKKSQIFLTFQYWNLVISKKKVNFSNPPILNIFHQNFKKWSLGQWKKLMYNLWLSSCPTKGHFSAKTTNSLGIYPQCIVTNFSRATFRYWCLPIEMSSQLSGKLEIVPKIKATFPYWFLMNKS